jgi:hypothetical protein
MVAQATVAQATAVQVIPHHAQVMVARVMAACSITAIHHTLVALMVVLELGAPVTQIHVQVMVVLLMVAPHLVAQATHILVQPVIRNIFVCFRPYRTLSLRLLTGLLRTWQQHLRSRLLGQQLLLSLIQMLV